MHSKLKQSLIQKENHCKWPALFIIQKEPWTRFACVDIYFLNVGFIFAYLLENICAYYNWLF